MLTRILVLVMALFTASAAMADLPANQPVHIGRLAGFSGAIDLLPSADAAPVNASVNYPLIPGNRIVTPPGTQATVDIAAGRFFLNGDSGITIGALGPGTSAITLDRGAVILRILPGGAGQVFVIDTPRGQLRADQPGYFEVAVAADTGAVSAAALNGGAQFTADANATMVLPSGTRATLAQGQAPVLAAAEEDDFTRRIAAEVAAAGDSDPKAPTHVSPQATGFNELERYGLWISTDRHGWVWEPQVTSDWAPFHNGRWVELPRLGRTWIEDAPWGFAPAHYGSWTKVNDRWVWVPGDAAQTATSVFNTNDDGDSGRRWVALGQEEPYFQASPVIVNNVRVITPPPPPRVVNVTTVNNNSTNVTTVAPDDDDDGLLFIPRRIRPHPPFPIPPRRHFGIPNITGLGATGTPIQRGVTFPHFR
jgi:hypothetical protein